LFLECYQFILYEQVKAFRKLGFPEELEVWHKKASLIAGTRERFVGFVRLSGERQGSKEKEEEKNEGAKGFENGGAEEVRRERR